MSTEDYLREHGISPTFAMEKMGVKEVISEKYGPQAAFPVCDAEGNFLFNKYRNLEFSKSGNIPKFLYDTGSTAQLYNYHNIKDSEYAFIFEGEPDTIKAWEDGIPAVCETSGAGTFSDEMAGPLQSKKVFIVYDNDIAGKAGAKKIMDKLPGALVIELPEDCKDYCEYRLKFTKADFNKLVKDVYKANSMTYDELCLLIDKWLLLPDKNVLKILFASLITHFFNSDPLWTFLVAPPSGTKTELISLISALPMVYFLSDLTPHTFISGFSGGGAKNEPSLLLRLNNNVIAMKDFTTVLSMREDDKQMILAQLREIYDGKYDKTFGTGKEVKWTGRLTLIAGVTGIIDSQQALFRVMGERFIMYRIIQPNDKLVAQKALSMIGQEKVMRKELQEGMRKFFWGIKMKPITDIDLPQEILIALASLASFVVIARSGIIRNHFTKDIELIPDPEAPARLTKQLGTLIKALAALANRKTVTWDDYYLTMRVAFDIVPRNKMIHLIAVSQFEEVTETKNLINLTGYSRAGVELVMDELVALKLASKIGDGFGSTYFWSLSEKSLDYLRDLLPTQSKEVFKIFPETDTYYPLVNRVLEESRKKSEENEENFINQLKKENLVNPEKNGVEK